MLNSLQNLTIIYTIYLVSEFHLIFGLTIHKEHFDMVQPSLDMSLTGFPHRKHAHSIFSVSSNVSSSLTRHKPKWNPLHLYERSVAPLRCLWSIFNHYNTENSFALRGVSVEMIAEVLPVYIWQHVISCTENWGWTFTTVITYCGIDMTMLGYWHYEIFMFGRLWWLLRIYTTGK